DGERGAHPQPHPTPLPFLFERDIDGESWMEPVHDDADWEPEAQVGIACVDGGIIDKVRCQELD
ncbi:hypothetical protein U1Q18_005212, partial [Sarracenia purpurea var. burkii]